MTNEQIEKCCEEKAQALLDNYFGNLQKEAAIERPETIGEYTLDLPLKIETEFKSFLEELWKEVGPEEQKGTPLVLEEQRLRELSTESHRENVNRAYKDATRRTLWERITHSNHEDVTYYTALLRDYIRELLTVMRLDFLEEVTGRHINTKTFEED